MDRTEIEKTMEALALSQGFYSRLCQSLRRLKASEPEAYDQFMDFMESKNFKDAVDMTMFLEGGICFG